MQVALEAAPLRPQGDISCAEAPPRSLQSVVPFSGRRQECFNAGTTLFETIHRFFTTCSCTCTSKAIVCGTHLAQSQFGAMALVALAEIRTPMEVEEVPHVLATQAL